MKLFYAVNTISVAVAIALEETDATYEAVKVDFGAAEQTKPEYLALNPKGRVPTIVHDGHILTETGALLEYCAPQLVPTDAFTAAKMREVMYYLASTMHVNHAHRMRGARWADQETSLTDMQQKVPETMTASCALLEDALRFAPFAVAESFTCADAYLYVVLSWLEGDGVTITDFPKLSAYFDMMSERACVKAVHAAGMLM